MKKATFTYNDNELLYMINEDSQEALEIMIEKYKPLIYSRLKAFRIRKSQIDDYYQECLLVLLKAIKNYDSKYQKTFTNYFDLMIQRKIMDLLRYSKNRDNHILCEDIDIVVAYVPKQEEIDEEKIIKLINKLSKFEQEVFILKFKENLASKEIANKLDVPIRKVYSATERIKSKL